VDDVVERRAFRDCFDHVSNETALLYAGYD